MSRDPFIVPVITKNVNLLWHEIEPWAEKFCAHSQGSYDPPFILDKLQKGQMQAWMVKNKGINVAACLTEIRQTKVKECVIVVMTGDNMVSWVHLLADLELYAKAMGCTKMKGIARPGWEKVIKQFGYTKKHVEMEKDL